MSRIGKQPITVPANVTVKVEKNLVSVKGPHGELKLEVHPRLTVHYDDAARKITVERPSDESSDRALHGLTRSLINNNVLGVGQPFEKKLEIQGVGYQAAIVKGAVVLNVGFANQIKIPIPSNVQVTLPDNTHIQMKSADKQAVGQFAAVIRRVRPPEPYKGKGIRYEGEVVKRKAGKAFAGG